MAKGESFRHCADMQQSPEAGNRLSNLSGPATPPSVRDGADLRRDGADLRPEEARVDAPVEELRLPLLFDVAEEDLQEMRRQVDAGGDLARCNAVANRFRRLLPCAKEVEVSIEGEDATAVIDGVRFSLGSDIRYWLAEAIRRIDIEPMYWLIEVPGELLPAGRTWSDPLDVEKSN